MSASEIVDAVVLFGTLIVGLLWVALVALLAVFAVGSVLAIPYALFSLVAAAVRRAKDARRREEETPAPAPPAPRPRRRGPHDRSRPRGRTAVTSH